MKSFNKKVTKIANCCIRLNTRLAALTALLTMVGFASHSWGMVPAARRAAVQTGPQIAPALYQRAAFYGLTNPQAPATAKTSAQIQVEELQRKNARRQAIVGRWAEQNRVRKDLEAQKLTTERLNNRTWVQRATGPRTLGTGLMRSTPSSPFGGIGIARPTTMGMAGLEQVGQRSFSSASPRPEATQQAIDNAEKNFSETLKKIDEALQKQSALNERASTGKATLSDRLIEWANKPAESGSPTTSLWSKTLQALGYQPPLESRIITMLFSQNNNGEVGVNFLSNAKSFSPAQIRTMRNFFAGLQSGENKIEDTSHLSDALLAEVKKADRFGYHGGPCEELELLSNLYLKNPQEVLDIVTAWDNIKASGTISYKELVKGYEPQNEADKTALNFFNKKEGYNSQALAKKYHPDLIQNDPEKQAEKEDVMSRVNEVRNIKKEFAKDVLEYQEGIMTLPEMLYKYSPTRVDDPLLKEVYKQLYKKI